MNVENAQSKYRAPALDKGLDILELLAEQPSGMTRGEIVKALDRGPSEIYRMLERLVVRGYVGRSFEGDRYALTMKLFQLGATFPPLRRLVMRAQPYLDVYAQETAQSVHLVSPDLGQAFVVAQATGISPWEFKLRLGAELDLFTTGSGHTLLAFMSDALLEHTLQMRAQNSTPIADDLQNELARIRNLGHRLGPSQQLVGVTDISVPVFMHGQEIVGVLTCPFLPHVANGQRDEDAQKTFCLERLLDMSAKITSSEAP